MAILQGRAVGYFYYFFFVENHIIHANEKQNQLLKYGGDPKSFTFPRTVQFVRRKKKATLNEINHFGLSSFMLSQNQTRPYFVAFDL